MGFSESAQLLVSPWREGDVFRGWPWGDRSLQPGTHRHSRQGVMAHLASHFQFLSSGSEEDKGRGSRRSQGPGVDGIEHTVAVCAGGEVYKGLGHREAKQSSDSRPFGAIASEISRIRQ